MFGTCGCTDSCIIDEQAGIEAAISIAMTNMSGANLNHDIGYAEQGTTSNLDLVVICDEILGMARKLTNGIRVDEDTLALDVIENVGPGGSFADEDHTEEHKEENYMPKLISRAAREIWEKAGGKTLTEVANEKCVTLSIITNQNHCQKMWLPRSDILLKTL